ncbi:hypothetical protein LMH73_021275 [Vibrio splendidus]|nr:hypothetical protein [Vibrio splendidus]MCC4880362.1 hypothetical protein [Vibrio splendidus]
MNTKMESAYYAFASTTRLDNGFSYRVVKHNDREVSNPILAGTVIHDGIYSEQPVTLASDGSLYWQPCIMLYKDCEPVGFLIFALKWGSYFAEYDSPSEEIVFELSYVFLKPSLRSNSHFSTFMTHVVESLLEDLSTELSHADVENCTFTFYAEYASKEGRYIGSSASELISDFCESNDFDFTEVIN